MRIAIADDDAELLDDLARAISGAGHDLYRFRNGSELKTALERETYDVVLLDWNMPGETGIGIVSWAVEKLPAPPPFIIITSRTDKADIVAGLQAGATDYVVKPEIPEVVLARIEAAGRRNVNKTPDRIAVFDAYRFDRVLRQSWHQGEEVSLTNKEFQLALLFFDNLNRPLSRGYIFSQVWGGSLDVESRTLDLHVSRIRSKLQLRPQNGYAIQTVFGFGYRMDRIADPGERQQ